MNNVRRVLVVDDDPAVAKAVARMLVSWGWEPEVFTTPSAALVAVLDSPCHALITDIDMPAMSGPGLAETAIELDPALKDRVIFVTGGDDFARAANIGAVIRKSEMSSELRIALEAIPAAVTSSTW